MADRVLEAARQALEQGGPNPPPAVNSVPKLGGRQGSSNAPSRHSSRPTSGASKTSHASTHTGRKRHDTTGENAPLDALSVAETALELITQAATGDPLLLEKLKFVYKSPVGIRLVIAVLDHISPESWRRSMGIGDTASALGLAYSRVVLTCSDYENTNADREFFEFLYEYLACVVQVCMPKDAWAGSIGKLHQLIRGPADNPNGADKDTNADFKRNIVVQERRMQGKDFELKALPSIGERPPRKVVNSTTLSNMQRTSKMADAVSDRIDAHQVLREVERHNDIVEAQTRANKRSRLSNIMWSRSPLVSRITQAPRAYIEENLMGPMSRYQAEGHGGGGSDGWNFQGGKFDGVLPGEAAQRALTVVEGAMHEEEEDQRRVVDIPLPAYPLQPEDYGNVHSKFKVILRRRNRLLRASTANCRQHYIPTYQYVNTFGTYEEAKAHGMEAVGPTERLHATWSGLQNRPRQSARTFVRDWVSVDSGASGRTSLDSALSGFRSGGVQRVPVEPARAQPRASHRRVAFQSGTKLGTLGGFRDRDAKKVGRLS